MFTIKKTKKFKRRLKGTELAQKRVTYKNRKL